MSMHNETPREHPDYYRMERPQHYADMAESELNSLVKWGSDPTISNVGLRDLIWDVLDTDFNDDALDFIVEIEAAGDKFLLLTPPATLLELAELCRDRFIEARAEWLCEKDKGL